MVVEELVLENGLGIVSDSKVSRLVAFPGVGASVSDHYSFEVYLHLGAGVSVHLLDLGGKVGNVNACVTLTCHVKLVVFELVELLEKFNQGVVVVFSH